MGIIFGIDIGGSNTKIVGFDGGRLLSTLQVRANDPVASLYGAFGKYLADNRLKLRDIERVMLTGVGSAFVNEKIYGIPTSRVDEFSSTGLGGLWLSELDRAVVVSMGTGTAFVLADGEKVTHIGGTGVGGGTLIGLANRMLRMHNFDDIIELAATGSLDNIDLKIKDITSESLSNLMPEATASNFGKVSDLATNGDLALGILNLIVQTVGVMAAFATKSSDTKTIVLTGYLSTIPLMRSLIDQIEVLFGIRFVIPENAEFATAIGAALSYKTANPKAEIK